jgi:outer membrane protein assembly factor BamB
VLDGQVWLTTATEDGHEFFVICIDAETGKTLLNEKVFSSENPESLGNGAKANSYATPSAVIEPGRVYIHFGSFGTACLDSSSFKVIWKRDDLPCRHYRGASSSPVLFENRLILTFDGADLQYHVALDKQTGKTIWKTNRSVKWNDEHIDRPMVREGDWRKAHSTPLIFSAEGKRRMFSVGAKAAYAYDPMNGQEIWKVEFHNWSVAPRPIFHNGRVIFVTGFSRSEMWAVRVGGTGDVTASHVDWKIKAPVPRYSSPIQVNDLIYIAYEESFVSCIEAATGEKVWKERIGGKFRASPIYADGRLYFFSQEGITTILKPGRTFQLLATNKLGEDAQSGKSQRLPGFTASPAVAGKALFLRTRDSLYRIESD